VKSLKNSAEGGRWNDQGEILQKLVVNAISGAGGKAKDEAGTKKCRKERKKEIKPKLSGYPKDIIR
jgi:hypothetical protein